MQSDKYLASELVAMLAQETAKASPRAILLLPCLAALTE